MICSRQGLTNRQAMVQRGRWLTEIAIRACRVLFICAAIG